MASWLDPLRAELDAEDARVDFFFRNDDAGWGDDALWPLVEIFDARGLPLDLAVIPRDLTETLARELLAWRARAHDAGFHQHGFAHVNHEPRGRKHEFGPARERHEQYRDIAEGSERLRELLGPHVDPIFTPPWNRCTRETGHCLVQLGFEAISREARATPLSTPGLVELPVNLDWFAHHKHVRLTRVQFGEALAGLVRESRRVGLMFHHAVMDHDERAAADELLDVLTRNPRVHARSMSALVADEAAADSKAGALSEIRS